MNFLYEILLGLVAGWLTGKIMKGSGFGFIWDIVIGIAGSLLGGWIASFIGFSAHNFITQLLVALVGAIILVFLFRLVTGKKG